MNNAMNMTPEAAANLARVSARVVERNMSRGAKYDANMTGPEIAKAIRTDIKAAQKAGDLPAMKVSVRFRWSTHAMAIDVNIKEWSGQIWSTKRVREEMAGEYTFTSRYTLAASLLVDAVKSYANAYNYDRSDRMTDYFDVNFYLSVDFDSDLCEASRKATEATVRAAYGVAS
jgi:hypothetical protein